MPTLNYAALRGLADRNEEAPDNSYDRSGVSDYDRYHDQEVQYPEEYDRGPYRDPTAGYAMEQNHVGTDPSSPYGEREPDLQMKRSTSLT